MLYYAIKAGFYAGSRVRAGETFDGPAGLKCKWAVPEAEKPAPAPAKGSPEPTTMSEMTRSKKKSFIESVL